jgi:hypothetical protein
MDIVDSQKICLPTHTLSEGGTPVILAACSLLSGWPMAYVNCEVLERRIIKVTAPEMTTASADNLLGLLFLIQLVMTSNYLRNFSEGSSKTCICMTPYNIIWHE